MDTAIEAILKHFGLPGAIAALSIGAVGWMLTKFLAAATDFKGALASISQSLANQQVEHGRIMEAQVQHTEVLRSMVIETRATTEGIHRSDMERSKELVELISTLSKRGA